MADKIFKILTIDGGGIKGLYSSKIIENIEEQFDCYMSDYFDMICGTSTGGILALALSAKMKAREISNLYEEKGNFIFPTQNKYRAAIKQVIGKGKYSDKNLKTSLVKTFGERRIADSNNLLCIPTYSYTDARPWIFKYDHKEGNSSRDNKTSYVDVALATSAAPTYFPLSEIECHDSKQFIDGGVYANDPSLVGFTEAIRFFVGEGKQFDRLMILSISSLTHSQGRKTGLRRKRSFRHWKSDLFEVMMTGQAKANQFFMAQAKNINGVAMNYVRIPSEILSSDQEKIVDIDNASKDSINLIKGKGNDAGQIWRKKPEVAEFFKNKKIYKTQ